MKNSTELYKEYIKIIEPKYKDIEKTRLISFFKFVLFFCIYFLFSGFSALYFTGFIIEGINNNILFLIVLSIAIIIAIGFSFNTAFYFSDDFKNNLKKIAMYKLLSTLCDNFRYKNSCKSYNCDTLIDSSTIKESELFFDYDSINYDDILSGSYNGIAFEVNEVYLTVGKDNKVFKGVIIAYQINKKANCNTIVATKNVLLRNNIFKRTFLIAISIFGIAVLKGILNVIFINSYNDLIIYIYFYSFYAVYMSFMQQYQSKRIF